MTTLANLAGGLLVQKRQVGLAIGGVALVTVDTTGCIGIACLPLGQENMEVVIEILALGHSRVAFQAVCIGDWAGQRRRLLVIAGDEGQ